MATVRNSRVLQVILMLIPFSLCGLSANAKYGGGTGEPNDPYLIRTAEQMNAIGADANDWGKHFKLMADIDLTSLGGNSFRIIGTDSNTPFRGTFEGNGHAIHNFVCKPERAPNVGLFGVVADPNAEIRNLRLVAPRIDSWEYNVGSLVGHLAQGTLLNCHAENVNVDGHSGNVGGLVGQTGSVPPSPRGTSATIRNSSCTGQVSGGYSGMTGGLTGRDWIGCFYGCFAACEVSSKYAAGGLAGYAGGTRFVDCYATGTVAGDSFTGGLVANALSGDLVNCYCASHISGTWHIGGFVGFDAMHVTASFWDAEINDGLDDPDRTGRTTAEMQDRNTFIVAGWDFVGRSDGPSDIWAEPAGGGYPILSWQLPEPPRLSFAGGTGTPDDPYLIATAEQLNSIGHNPRLMQAHFKVIDSIDLSGLHFWPIGNEDYAFGGVFDGGDFTIANFTYTAVESQDVGVFRIISGAHANVQSVRLVNPLVTADSATNVGSLVGRLRQGTSRKCHVEGGRVSGKTAVGGLVGQTGVSTNTEGEIVAQLVNCSAATAVTGQSTIGGLVGMNSRLAMVSDCRANGDVNGQSAVGGLAGVNLSTIINSRATGTMIGTRSVGGLVGASSHGDIRCSFSKADVQGDTQVGGLVGSSYSTIADCYAIADVTGKDTIGGLVGQNGHVGSLSSPGTISRCYSAGRVSGTQSVGGLVGYNELGATAASFWDRETSGLRVRSGQTTSQMHTASTFLDAGWDFVDETQNGTEDTWWILEGQDYPRLSWERDRQP